MSLRVCLQQVFQRTRRTTSDLFCSACVYRVNYGTRSVVLLQRISSVSDQRFQEKEAGIQKPSGRSNTEETLYSLVQLGFTQSQAEQVISGARNNRPRHSLALHFCGISNLMTLGLKSSSVVKILEKCPELYRVKGQQLQQRVDNLRKLGLMEGGLQRVISYYPVLLTLSPKRVNAMCSFLQEKCLFTSQQVTEIVRDFPETMLEDTARLEYKFQYAYFRMGILQPEMLRSGLFRVSLEDLRCRHSFLERRGLYQTPDKKGQTRIANPSLKDVIGVAEDTFLSKIALATREEFEVFRKLLSREQEEELQDGLSSDEEEEEEDGEKGYESNDT